MNAPLKKLIEKLTQLRDLSTDNVVKATYQIAITEAKDLDEYESDYVRKKISDSDKVWKEMTEVKANIGDMVSFRYKGGRRVKGELLSISKSIITIQLHTDYIGKNVEWFAGESKHFNVKEIRKLNLTPKDK